MTRPSGRWAAGAPAAVPGENTRTRGRAGSLSSGPTCGFLVARGRRGDPGFTTNQKGLIAMNKPIDSTSDDRTANNAVRHQYRVLSDDEKVQMQAIKDMGAEFIRYLDEITPLGRSRDIQLAVDHIEDATMRAVRHVTA